MLDVLATGYPSFDYIIPTSHSPKVGETALIRDIPDDTNASYGGCGVNVAVALRRLGFRCGVAMILGDDYQGSLYRSRLATEGIDQSDLIIVPRARTSRSYLFRNEDGEYQNFFFPGAADLWNGTLRLRNQNNTRYALVTVGPYHYNRQFVSLFRNARVPIIWQLKPDIFAYTQDAVRDFAQASRYILMNHIEADFVLRTLSYAKPQDLINDTTLAIFVTRGEKGSTLYTAQGEIAIPAARTQVVDTVGAGDAYTAGLLAGILRDYNLETSARIGSVMASFVLEKIGCQTNLPNWAQMQSRYESNFGPL